MPNESQVHRLLESEERLRDLGVVVIDEIHMISDPSRVRRRGSNSRDLSSARPFVRAASERLLSESLTSESTHLRMAHL